MDKSKCLAFVFSLAAQVDEDAFFRELLTTTFQKADSKIRMENLEDIISEANQLLPDNKLRLQKSSSDIYLLENRQGMVIKLIAKKGILDVDAYYSYPATSNRDKQDYEYANIKLKSDMETISSLVEYALVNKFVEAKNDISETDIVLDDSKLLEELFTIPIIAEAVRTSTALKKEELNFRIMKIAVVIGSYVTSSILVQWLISYYSGNLGLYFMAFFFSGLLGVLINQFINEVILIRVVKLYSERLKLGDDRFNGEQFIIAYVFNIAMYLATFIFVPTSAIDRIALFIGFVFSIYPMNFLMNIMFAMKKIVINHNSHHTELRKRYYANTIPEKISNEDMLPVTVTLAIYTEDNKVVFDTMRDSMRAIENYQKLTGKPANFIVSDDGIFKLLAGPLVEGDIDEYILKFSQPGVLSNNEMQAIERIIFYRQHNISYVARPIQGRPGKFKKGGNLNYTYRLAEKVAQGHNRKELLGRDSEFYGCYYEGEIVINDIILLLDKDSGVPEDIIVFTIPEFLLDPKLAYTQHCTKSINSNNSYFTKSMGNFLDTLSETHLPNKALQGLVVPLMGHNAFLRKSFLMDSGMWNEDRVSEDLAKSLDAYRFGYHGKYVTYKDLDFTEYVCETFAEETAKQQRYCYGIHEMIFKDFREHFDHHFRNIPYEDERKHKLQFFYMVDLFTYFCSCINIAACIPTTVFLMFTIFVQYFFGGIIINLIVYFIFPVIHSVMMSIKTKRKNRFLFFMDYALLGFTFFGHAYSMMKGSIGFVVDTVAKSYNPFNATNVDNIENNFLSGVNIIYEFFKKNIVMLLVILVFLVRGIIILLNEELTLSVILSVGYLISYTFIIPILTPQLFHRPRFLKKKLKLAQISNLDVRG